VMFGNFAKFWKFCLDVKGTFTQGKSSEQASFTSEFVGSILATDSVKSWVFSGCSGFLPHGKLTGWVRINTVKKVISQLV
jgi:hypothetical protein